MSDSRSDNGAVLKALADLDARLERVEYRLGIRSTHVEESPLNAAPPAPPPRAVASPTPPPVPVAVAVPTPEARAEHLEALARRKLAAASAARTEAPATPPLAPPRAAEISVPAVYDTPAPKKPRGLQEFGLERMVGMRLAAVAGCLFLVVGIILGLKYGIDRGWISFSPERRCIGVGMLGLLIVGVGEFIRRRLDAAGAIAASAVSGAGLAAMYGSVLAAYGMYHLIGTPAAFVLLAVVSALGIGVALWSQSLALGVLSLIGAYLNPLFMKESSSPVVLPVYLTALLVLGLVLAGWRPRIFRGLRPVAWWGTVLIGTGWLGAGHGMDHPFVALPFLAVVWALVHAELYIGSRREPEAAGPAWAWWASYRFLATSFATTMWSVGAGVVAIRMGSSPSGIQDWMVTAAGLIGTGALGMILAGNLRAFRDLPNTDAERLGVALWAQAGALLIATVALALSNWTQTVAWLAMGVAGIAAGRWARAKSLEVYGLIVLLIAIGRLVFWDSWQGYGQSVEILGLSVRQGWFLLMLIGGLAWLAAAWLLRRPAPIPVDADASPAAGPSRTRLAIADACTAVGVTLPFAGLINQDARGVTLAAMGIVWVLSLLVIARLRRSVIVQLAGVGALAIVSLVVCGVHLSGEAGLSHFETVLLHLKLTDWSFVMLGVGAAWLFGAWLVGSMDGPGNHAGSIVMVAIGAAGAMAALLVPGTSWGAVCVAWTLLGFATCLAHAAPPLRRMALDEIGQCVLVAAAGMWILAYVLIAEWLGSKLPPLTHPGLWSGVGLACAMLAITTWLGRTRWGLDATAAATWEPGLNALRVMAGILLLTSTSFEVSRSAGIWVPSDEVAQAAVLTVWWGLFAVGMLLVGFFLGRGGIPIVRHLGLALLFIAAGKLVFIDLATVGEGWRVISFAGLGTLMLAVAVGYAWASRKMATQTVTA